MTSDFRKCRFYMIMGSFLHQRNRKTRIVGSWSDGMGKLRDAGSGKRRKDRLPQKISRMKLLILGRVRDFQLNKKKYIKLNIK